MQKRAFYLFILDFHLLRFAWPSKWQVIGTRREARAVAWLTAGRPREILDATRLLRIRSAGKAALVTGVTAARGLVPLSPFGHWRSG